MYSGPGVSFWLYYQEFILRKHLQNVPSKSCMSEMSWGVVYRGQQLATASMSINGTMDPHGDHSTIKPSKRSYICMDSEKCIVRC